MDEYDDLATYNGDSEHDMWVDFDNYLNTGTPDVFSDDPTQQADYADNNLNDTIDNLNDWH